MKNATIAILVIAAFLLGAAITFIVQNSNVASNNETEPEVSEKELGTSEEEATPSVPQPTQHFEEQIYTSQKLGLSLRYAKGWTISESIDEITLTKDEYELDITKNAYEPDLAHPLTKNGVDPIDVLGVEAWKSYIFDDEALTDPFLAYIGEENNGYYAVSHGEDTYRITYSIPNEVTSLDDLENNSTVEEIDRIIESLEVI